MLLVSEPIMLKTVDIMIIPIIVPAMMRHEATPVKIMIAPAMKIAKVEVSPTEP